MHPLQFGKITRIVRQDTTTLSFPQNIKAPDYAAQVQAYRDADRQQDDSYNAQCAQLLQNRSNALQQTPDARVNLYKLFNVGDVSGNCILIDGEDLKQFAYDCLLKTQQLMDAAIQTVRQNGYDVSYAKMNNLTEPPKAFNWMDIPEHSRLHVNFEHYPREAQSLVAKEYWDKATDSVTIVV